MTCCTENAWGVLNNPDYKEKGIVDKIDDLDIYRVGESSKCIIWCYDVFGFKVSTYVYLGPYVYIFPSLLFYVYPSIWDLTFIQNQNTKV